MNRTPEIRGLLLRLEIVFLLVFGVLAPAGNHRAAAAGEGPFPTNGNWTEEFKPAGPNGNVYAMVRDPVSGDLYVGGTFSLPGQNIARWDGSRWWTLGSGIDWTVSTVKA